MVIGRLTTAALTTTLALVVLVAAVTGAVLTTGAAPSTSSWPTCGPVPDTGGSSTSTALRTPLPPRTYRITSPFGTRTHPVTGAREDHRGLDLAAPDGTPIRAAAPGTVAAAGPARGFGHWIVLDHTRADGTLYSTVYGHMWSTGVSVTTGQTVTAGQHIGHVGNDGHSTGPHLHLELWPGGRLTGRGAPIDPDPHLVDDTAPPGPLPPAISVADLMPRPPTTPQRDLRATDEQRAHAITIVIVGRRLGLPPRAWVIAVATALQESGLRNLPYGDRDSLGLFQQRPSQGWGTPAQILDPTYSAERFYRALRPVLDADPDWRARPLTEIAQTVQRSGYPRAYAPWETVAIDLVLDALPHTTC